MYVIYQRPQKVAAKGTFFTLSEKKVFFEKSMENVFKELQTFVDFKLENKEDSNINNQKNNGGS